MCCWGRSHVNYVGVHEVKAQKRPKTIWFGFPGSLGDLGGLEYGERNNAWNMAKETMPSLVSFLGLQCSRVVDVNGKLLMSWLTMSCIVDAKKWFPFGYKQRSIWSRTSMRWICKVRHTWERPECNSLPLSGTMYTPFVQISGSGPVNKHGRGNLWLVWLSLKWHQFNLKQE